MKERPQRDLMTSLGLVAGKQKHACTEAFHYRNDVVTAMSSMLKPKFRVYLCS